MLTHAPRTHHRPPPRARSRLTRGRGVAGPYRGRGRGRGRGRAALRARRKPGRTVSGRWATPWRARGVAWRGVACPCRARVPCRSMAWPCCGVVLCRRLHGHHVRPLAGAAPTLPRGACRRAGVLPSPPPSPPPPPLCPMPSVPHHALTTPSLRGAAPRSVVCRARGVLLCHTRHHHRAGLGCLPQRPVTSAAANRQPGSAAAAPPAARTQEPGCPAPSRPPRTLFFHA